MPFSCDYATTYACPCLCLRQRLCLCLCLCLFPCRCPCPCPCLCPWPMPVCMLMPTQFQLFVLTLHIVTYYLSLFGYSLLHTNYLRLLISYWLVILLSMHMLVTLSTYVPMPLPMPMIFRPSLSSLLTLLQITFH